MTSLPTIDVNLLAYNAEATIGAAIESVLAQDWPSLSLTILDNGSTDATLAVAEGYAREVPWLRIHRGRANAGQVVNVTRAFAFGEADYVMPQTADDLLAPGFVRQVMAVLLAYPDCAMCHAGGLVFDDRHRVVHAYPDAHRLHAVGDAPLARCGQVMARYTSAPSFWGIYRRAATARLSPFHHRAGWDHAVLAELALYGEIRHVPDRLFWRRDGGKPVDVIARGATLAAQRGHDVDGVLCDPHWRTPLITTAHTHLLTLAAADLPEPERLRLLGAVPGLFRARWLAPMRAEWAALRRDLPALLDALAGLRSPLFELRATALGGLLQAVAAILPDMGAGEAAREVAAVTPADPIRAASPAAA